MFSGIITNLVTPVSIKRNNRSMTLTLPYPEKWKLEIGESINVDGVCSTIEKMDSKTFSIYYMPETLDKTTFENVNEEHSFNLERCITLKTLISGHLVYGHVDTTAQVSKVAQDQESTMLTFKIPKEFTKYIVYKGSISVNGVSLTIVEVLDSSFSVALIPHTKDNTNLGALAEGDFVNIEVDMLAKHIEKLIAKS